MREHQSIHISRLVSCTRLADVLQPLYVHAGDLRGNAVVEGITNSLNLRCDQEGGAA